MKSFGRSPLPDRVPVKVRIRRFVRRAVPTPALILLMVIGLIDLVTTAYLHSMGMIREMNPLMRVFIEQNEWLFVIVKGTTLFAAWWLMALYARSNRDFVIKASYGGSAAYVLLWLVWYTAGNSTI